ncbi:hypothetical protein [Anaeromicropila herbilytica]|nr:hypothetical protein [Anaeromicropila herbilytica]
MYKNKNKDKLLPDHIMHVKKEFNKGVGKILTLVAVALVAILSIYELKYGITKEKGDEIDYGFKVDASSDINQLEKVNNSKKIVEDKVLDNVRTANNLGSIVSEKVDLSYYTNSKDIKSVYRIYDMNENHNGYLVQVLSEGENERLLIAVMFDNIGEKILSVKVLKGLNYIPKNHYSEIHDFCDQFNRIHAPIALKEEKSYLSKYAMTKEYSKNNIYKESFVNEIKGEKESSIIIVKGINNAYRFLKNIIILDSNREEHKKL